MATVWFPVKLNLCAIVQSIPRKCTVQKLEGSFCKMTLNQVTEDTYSRTPEISQTTQYIMEEYVRACVTSVPSERGVTEIRFRVVGLPGVRQA